MSDHCKLLQANYGIILTDKNNCADLKHWSFTQTYYMFWLFKSAVIRQTSGHNSQNMEQHSLKDQYIRSEQLCLSVNITP